MEERDKCPLSKTAWGGKTVAVDATADIRQRTHASAVKIQAGDLNRQF